MRYKEMLKMFIGALLIMVFTFLFIGGCFLIAEIFNPLKH
jgi:hypothetical protein